VQTRQAQIARRLVKREFNITPGTTAHQHRLDVLHRTHSDAVHRLRPSLGRKLKEFVLITDAQTRLCHRAFVGFALCNEARRHGWGFDGWGFDGWGFDGWDIVRGVRELLVVEPSEMLLQKLRAN
jgi:hypothetical protein